MSNKQTEIQQLIKHSKFEEAIRLLEQVTENPVWKNSLMLRCLRGTNQSTKALNFADFLFAQNPSDIDQLHLIALTFFEQNRRDDAIEILQQLSQDFPDNIDLLRTYGSILASGLVLDEAEQILHRILKTKPKDVAAYAQLARILCRTGRVEEGLLNYKRCTMLEPDQPVHMQRLVYWSNYSDNTTAQSSAQLARLWAKRAYPANTKGSDTWRYANPNKPLKIGFISSDFCKHAVSFFITPLLKHINRDQFSVVAYSNVQQPDEVTEEIKQYCDTWKEVANLPDNILSAQIGADQLDVLIDLNGHTANNRLNVFSQHLVPIQISWLGYPGTTGLDSMHYRITDEIADPNPEEDNYYSEQLIRLPNSFLCYQPYQYAPAIVSPATTNDSIRFGSFNNLAKISPSTLDAWAGVLHAIPGSTLYLKRQQLINQSAQQYFISEFAKRGIEQDRLILKTSKAKIEQHLSEYNQIDIALDTSPYNGTTTTLEALWMGKPVLTMTGKTHASRVSASILSELNLHHLISHSKNEFIAKAIELNNHEKLMEFSKSIRTIMQNSSLLNHQQFANDFCTAIRQKWHIWCQQLNEEFNVEKTVLDNVDE